MPQTPGMWFEAELPQPATLTEVQFDSPGGGGGGRAGGGRAALPPAPAPGAPAPAAAGRGANAFAAPTPGYPRAYSVEVSMDGKKWSKPVATGKGEGMHTTITFPPTRAQFVRITQTDNVADAPAWSIRSLRLYEAHTGTK